jgi:toxin YoeB
MLFSVRAWGDCVHWRQTDNKLVEKIIALLKDIFRNSYSGIGELDSLKNFFYASDPSRIYP